MPTHPHTHTQPNAATAAPFMSSAATHRNEKRTVSIRGKRSVESNLWERQRGKKI